MSITTSSTSSFPRLLWIEWRKLRGRMLFWGMTAILFLLVVGLHLLLISALGHPQGKDMPPQMIDTLRQGLMWPAGAGSGLSFASSGGLGGMLVIILVGAFMAQEYSWRSLQLLLSRGVRRLHFLLAKFTVLSAAIFVLTLVAFLAGAAVTAGYTIHTHGTLPWDQVAWGTLWRQSVIVFYTLLPYAAFTLLIAILARSPLVAVGVGLGYSLLVEGLLLQLLSMLSQRAAAIAAYFPAMLGQSLLQSQQTQVDIQIGMASAPDNLLSASTAAILLGIYTLLALTLAWLAFQRQDLI